MRNEEESGCRCPPLHHYLLGAVCSTIDSCSPPELTNRTRPHSTINLRTEHRRRGGAHRERERVFVCVCMLAEVCFVCVSFFVCSSLYDGLCKSNLEKQHIKQYIIIIIIMWAKDANQDLWCDGVCGGGPDSRKHVSRAPPSGLSHLLTVVTK